MNWKDILKNSEVDDRWKEYRASRESRGKRGRPSIRKPSQPKSKCAMCGKRLSKYGHTTYETDTPTGLKYCKQCAEFRSGKK